MNNTHHPVWERHSWTALPPPFFVDFRCIDDISRRSYHLDHFRRPPQTLKILKNMATEQSGVQLKPMGYGGSRVYALGYIQLGYTLHQRVDHDGGADQQYNIGCHHVCCGRPAASALGQPKTLWGSIGQDDRNDQLMLRESERSLLVHGFCIPSPFLEELLLMKNHPPIRRWLPYRVVDVQMRVMSLVSRSLHGIESRSQYSVRIFRQPRDKPINVVLSIPWSYLVFGLIPL